MICFIRVPTETGKPGKLNTVMEKSLKTPKSHGTCKIGKKSWNFVYRSWNFTNFAPELYKICMFFVTTEKLRIHVESLIFLCFPANAANAKPRREMVVEN